MFNQFLPLSGVYTGKGGGKVWRPNPFLRESENRDVQGHFLCTKIKQTNNKIIYRVTPKGRVFKDKEHFFKLLQFMKVELEYNYIRATV